jgi:hypothetical protein
MAHLESPPSRLGQISASAIVAFLTEHMRAAGPPRLFGLRVWASACLALYVAFRPELENPFWAGTTAAIV